MPESRHGDDAEPAVDSNGRGGGPDSFAAMLAHDLRNPLTVARARVSLASEEFESEHLEAALAAHERMDDILSDYLALARRGSMVVDEETVDLASVAEQSWRYVPTKEATLALETERVISADRDRLRQLLENLMRNAVEHGGSGVTVTVGDVADGFYVVDDGPGIPLTGGQAGPEATNASVPDTSGFGLSIVSTIVEAHGWELTVINDEGARFEITGVTVVP